MNPKLLLLVLPLLLVAVFVAVPQIPKAHANPFTGQVCLQDLTSVSDIDPAPCSHEGLNVAPHLDGPTTNATTGGSPNQQITIGVYLNNSDPANGWDITLLANHHYLVPTSVNPTNSIFGPVFLSGATLSVIVLCEQGLLKTGTTCLPTDTIDTLHYSVVGGKTTPGLPVSGLLFTATYNITNTTPAGGVTIGYQVGCLGAVSVSGQCVTITNGTPTPDVETDLGAIFDNSNTPAPGAGTGTTGVPYVTMSAATTCAASTPTCTATPTSVTVLPGKTASVTLTATAQNGWPGQSGVNLGCTPGTGAPAGCSADSVGFSDSVSSTAFTVGLSAGTSCITAGASCSPSPITITAASGATPTPAGNYFVTFFGSYVANSFTTGQNNTLSAPWTISIKVIDYSWTVTPTSVNIAKGGKTAFSLATGTLTSLNGFSGSVSFSPSPSPVTGLKTFFNGALATTSAPVTVTLGAGATVTETIAFNATAEAKFTDSLRACSVTTCLTTGLVHNVPATVFVNGFNITDTAAGHSVTFTTTTGSATDSIRIQSLPAGSATAGFGAPGTSGAITFTTAVAAGGVASTALTASCTSLTVTAGGTVTGANNCTFSSTTANTYTVTITGTGGTNGVITNSTIVTVIVQGVALPDFTVSASPTSVSVVAGSPGTSSITIAPTNGFTGTVGLTSDNSACTLNPTSVSGGSGTSTLSCTFATVGTVVVTVTGTSGSLTHTATVTFTVTPAPDFTFTANPTSVPVVVGTPGTSTITVAPLNGFTGTVALSLSVSPTTGLTCTLSSISITGGSGTSTLSCTASATGSFTVTVTGISGSLSHTAMVTYSATSAPDFSIAASPTSVSVVVGSAGTSMIAITPLNGFTATVALTSDNSACTLTPPSVTGGSGTSTLSCTFTATGSVTVTVTGTSGSLTRTATVAFTVTPAPDFTVTASPSAVPVIVNLPGTSTITVSPLNGFTNTVTLAADNTACSLTSTTISGGSGTSTLSCTFTVTGTVAVHVTGTSGSLSHAATVTFTVSAAPDFSISANPSAVSVVVGTAGTSTITISPLNSFTGTVGLASDNTACSLSSTSLTGGSGTSTLSCTFTATGSVVVTVTGTSGTLSHTATVTYTVTASPDFNIIASPSAVSVVVGSAGTSTITITPLNSFTATVALTSDNTACTLSPTSVSGGSGTSKLSCTFTATGSVTVTITGSSGTLSHTATVSFTVTPAPDFTVTANPATVAVAVNSPGTSTITVAALNGFTSTVSLAADNTACSLSSTSFTGGAGTSTLSCTFTTTGTVVVTVTGTSGTLTHSATVTFTVTAAADFSISANPTAVSVVVGTPGTSTITISPLNGFTNTVGLTSDNTACTLSATSVAGGSGTSTLSCTFTSTGSVTVTVTGTSGALTHTATVVFTVTPAPDFSITSNPTSVAVAISSPGTSTISISPLNGFTATVNLASDNTACSLSSTSITGGTGTSTLSCTFANAGTVIVTITGTSGTLAHSATVTFAVLAAADFSLSANPSTVSVPVGIAGTSTITISPLNGFASTVALTSDNSGCSLSSTSVTGGSGTSTLSCTFATTGSVTVTVTGTSGTLVHTTTVMFTVTPAPDFSLTANPTTISFTAGGSGTSTITITGLNGFSGTVSLTATASDPSLTATLSTTSVSGSGTSTLAVTGTTAGAFTVTVTGTSGTLVHTATVTINVAAQLVSDFSISASPTSVPLVVNSPGTSTITVSPINGFTGDVGLSADDSACSLTPITVAGGTGTSTFSCTFITTGTVVVTVTGTSGTLSHSTSVTFTVSGQADFTISANPTSVSVNSGVTGTSLITIASVNGFAGPVTLSTSISPSTGLTCSLNPTVVMGGSGSSTLSCSGTSGNYTVTVTGTSETLSHSVNVTFHVTQPTGQPVQLTFSAFDADDFDNGVGQLQVFVNGNLVVDIPAGLNHLTGSGDYTPYTSRWINFGPFNITSFIVNGQNNITFTDLNPNDHFSLVRNVMIVQGSTTLLNVRGAAGIYPAHSRTYTFSVPPLVLTSFTASPASPSSGDSVTFTATYTGGTAPFKCIFGFGDGQFAFATGVAGTCTVAHQYSNSGTFNAFAIIKGASTSDLVKGHLTVTVSDNQEGSNSSTLLVTGEAS